MGETANILKISKSSIDYHLYQLDYVNHFDVWVPYKLSEKNSLAVFLHMILYWNVRKLFHFKNKLWQAIKSGYCTIMCNGKDGGKSKMNYQQPHHRPIFRQIRWCCIYGGTGSESSIMSSFWKTKQLILTSTAPNLINWEQHATKKCPESVNRKWIIFHQDTVSPHFFFFWWLGKNCYSLAKKFWFIHCIHQTLHLQMSI